MKTKRSKKEYLKGVHAVVAVSNNRMTKSISDALTSIGCKVTQVTDLDSAVEQAQKNPAKVLILELTFCEAYEAQQKENPLLLEQLGSVVFIVASESNVSDAADWAHNLKCYFVTTPVVNEEVAVLLEHALDKALLQERLNRYESPEESVERFGPIVSRSLEMKNTVRVARIMADRDDPLLIVGGVGSGKELMTRAIHESSPRRHAPFMALNCTSFEVDDLMLELFGSDNSDSSEPCLLEKCNGGTLLIDEISAISTDMQGKLQRFLEDGTFTRVNSRNVCRSDVRVLAATSKPLDEMVARGHFSETLYFLINRFTLFIPSLRRRIEDIPVLTREILKRIGGEQGKSDIAISEDALKLLVEYTWPGNVRELENVLEYAMLVGGDGPIQSHHLPKQFHDEVGSIFVGSTPEELPPMSEIERQYILRVMDSVKGNKVKAAKILDINRATLHRKLQIYDAQKHKSII